MTDTRKVPEIRFKGFSGEWEEQELGEIVTPFAEPVPTPKDGYWRLGIRSHTKGTFHDFVRPGKELETAKMHKVRTNNFIVNITFAWEHAVAITGSSDDGKLVSHRFPQFSFNDGMVPEYFKFLILDKQFKHHLWLSSPGGAGRNRVLKLSKMLEYPFGVPNETEQSEIANFFQNLDCLITLHQRKHDKLTTVKKAMLEKMFPKEGADVPEIRFKGFTEKWERRTLGDLYSERNQRGNDSLQILSVSIHHGVSSGELDSDTLGKQVRRSEDKSLYKRVYFGDLVFNMMRAWQGAIGVVKAEGMVSPAYITAIPNELVFPLFMDCCMKRSQIITQMDNLSYGVTDFRKRLYWDSFIRVLCLIPSVSEQANITDYFQNLDSLITLQQRELDKLKNIKKACLEKMFV